MDGIEEMRSFLNTNNIAVRDVVQMNNPDAKFNSYKVSVTVHDATKMMNCDMWQTGICVKRWRNFSN